MLWCHNAEFTFITGLLVLVSLYAVISFGVLLGSNLQESWRATPLNVVTPVVLFVTCSVALWELRRLGSSAQQLARYGDENNQYKHLNNKAERQTNVLKEQVDALQTAANELAEHHKTAKQLATEYQEENTKLENNVLRFRERAQQLQDGFKTAVERADERSVEAHRLEETLKEMLELNAALREASESLRTEQAIVHRRLEQANETGRKLEELLFTQSGSNAEYVTRLLTRMLDERLITAFHEGCSDYFLGLSRTEFGGVMDRLTGELRSRLDVWERKEPDIRSFDRWVGSAGGSGGTDGTRVGARVTRKDWNNFRRVLLATPTPAEYEPSYLPVTPEGPPPPPVTPLSPAGYASLA